MLLASLRLLFGIPRSRRCYVLALLLCFRHCLDGFCLTVHLYPRIKSQWTCSWHPLALVFACILQHFTDGCCSTFHRSLRIKSQWPAKNIPYLSHPCLSSPRQDLLIVSNDTECPNNFPFIFCPSLGSLVQYLVFLHHKFCWIYELKVSSVFISGFVAKEISLFFSSRRRFSFDSALWYSFIICCVE